MKKSSKKGILIIEDNDTYRELLKMRLKANGYQIYASSNGTDGLRMARKELPDLILVDLVMPGINGHEVCRQLNVDPDIAHIPIIILTCINNVEDVEMARHENVEAYILKSMMTEVILEIIRRVLKKGKRGQRGSDQQEHDKSVVPVENRSNDSIDKNIFDVKKEYIMKKSGSKHPKMN